MAKKNGTAAKKEYAPSFGFWPARSGNGYTVKVTEQLLETLSKAKEGGRLLLTEVPEDKREENEALPAFRVTIFTDNDNTSESL